MLFRLPSGHPLARFILISPGLIFDNTTYYDYRTNQPHYDWTRDAIDGARAAGIPWLMLAPLGPASFGTILRPGVHKACARCTVRIQTNTTTPQLAMSGA